MTRIRTTDFPGDIVRPLFLKPAHRQGPTPPPRSRSRATALFPSLETHPGAHHHSMERHITQLLPPVGRSFQPTHHRGYFRPRPPQLSRAYRTSTELYRRDHRASIAPDTRENFWLKYAREKIDWFQEPSVGLDSLSAPLFRWFPDGTTNLCHNSVDRWVSRGRGTQTAIAYESAVGGLSRNITFDQLLVDVSHFAGVLASLGVCKGDRILIYMPMIPEAIVAMLACTRIGAVHSVVFGGFAAPELAVRIDDATPKVIVTATCGLEAGKGEIAYWPLVENALGLASHSPDHIVVKHREEASIPSPCSSVALPQRQEGIGGRDNGTTRTTATDATTGTTTDPSFNTPPLHYSAGSSGWTCQDYASLMASADPHPCVPLRASDPLYILYTSGTTGQPKGVLRDNSHSVALRYAMEHFMNLQEGETYWAASDIGWVVGHSFTAFGPLLHGCTSLLYEGKPVGTPDASHYWRLVARHGVTALFTAPTALRAIRKEDPSSDGTRQFDLSSLRTLFVAGERGDPDTIAHFQHALQIPVVDNWWQTETGSPICGMQLEGKGTVLGSCGLPLPGWDVHVVCAEFFFLVGRCL